VGNQGTRVAVSGTGGSCSKEVPRPVVAYDQRALPITGILALGQSSLLDLCADPREPVRSRISADSPVGTDAR
jgi:hypothetical protein